MGGVFVCCGNAHVIIMRKRNENKGSSSLHVVPTRPIDNRINPHIHTRHPRHRVHVRTRALAVWIMAPIALAIPGRTTARAAHAARVRMVMVVRVAPKAGVGCIGRVSVGRGGVRLRGGAAGVAARGGGSSVGRGHAAADKVVVGVHVVGVHVVDGGEPLDSADAAVIVVGVVGGKACLEAFAAGGGTGSALQVFKTHGHALW